MTRRLVRSAVQFVAFLIVVLVLIAFLDDRYDVLPQAIHDHLPAHHPGLFITDVSISTCSTLNLISSCRLDPKEWHRIEKDLFLDKGWVSKAYLHVKRKQETELTADDKVVVDIRVGRLDPTVGASSKAEEKWEARPGGLWIQRSSRRHTSESKNAVTAVDVLFGADAVEPRPGWAIKDTAFLLDVPSGAPEPRITIRKGTIPKLEKPQPRIRKDGKFKIMQVADLHFSTGLGQCRDPEPAGVNGGKCEADPRTTDFIGKLLDQEEPDLVVLSGDQINGETAPDLETAMYKVVEEFSKRHIPYAAIFGNHDDEGSLDRASSMALLQTLPYSLSEAGPGTISGVGNYAVEVLAHNTQHSALTLYLLDTHSYSSNEKKYSGYDWIKEDQIQWFRETARALKVKHKDYSKIHMNMAFIHIPLPEYSNKDNKIVGEWREGVTAPKYNSGFKDALVDEHVVVVSCGHDHANDYCSLDQNKKTKKPDLWMCYGGGAGFGGYGGYGGYHRRIRFFEIDTNAAKIMTYKRLEYGNTERRLDEQVLVEDGEVKTK